MKIEYIAITDRGNVRLENQDTLYCSNEAICATSFEAAATVDLQEPRMFAVFDGMGGELCGKEAADIAAKELERQTITTPLSNMCLSINERLCEFMQEHEIKSMGTTAAIIRIQERGVDYCNIGDSRIYLIQHLSMYRLSKDDSMTAFSGRRMLTQHLGIPAKEILIEPHVGTVPVSSGTIILLCSDGLTDMLSEQEIGKTIVTNPLQRAAQELKREALERGGKDNISLILIKVL